MVIDFHTHVFPDKLARGAVKKLVVKSGYPIHADGTLADTCRAQRAAGVDRFVLLNVAVRPEHVRAANDFVIASNGGSVLSFGCAHPYDPRAEYELDRICDAGLKGVKLHPEYQDFSMDDPKAYRLYEQCASRDLVMLIHSGYDPGYPGSDKSDPVKAQRIANDFSGAKLVFAHLGNAADPESALAYLCGKNVYLDTAKVDAHMGAEGVHSVIRAHGAHRILYGTDCPLGGPENEMFLRSLKLGEEAEELIFHKNAEHLLGL